MGSGLTIGYNTNQIIPEIQINGRIVLQPHIWYICPPEKKAICRGKIQCTNRGAAAITRFRIGSTTSMFEWNNALNGSLSSEILPRGLGTGSGGQFGFFDNVQLVAGETIDTLQDVGTNAEFNLWAIVQESPV